VTDGFLHAIGARVVAGRLLDRTDFVEGAAEVVVVNEPFVQKFFGGRNAVGRRIKIEDRGSDQESPWREIVGVVPDLGLSVGDPALAGGTYTPAGRERLFALAMRTDGDPKTLAAPLRCSWRSRFTHERRARLNDPQMISPPAALRPDECRALVSPGPSTRRRRRSPASGRSSPASTRREPGC